MGNSKNNKLLKPIINNLYKFNFVFQFLYLKLLYPFTNDLAYLLILFFIYYIPDFFILMVTGPKIYLLYFALYTYIISYFIVFIVDLIPKLSRFLKIIVLSWFILFALINLYCVIVQHTRLNHDIISTLLGTNLFEIWEYFKHQMNIKIFTFTILLVVLIYLTYLFLKKLLFKPLNQYFSLFLFIFFLYSCVFISNLNGAIKNDLTYGINFSYDDFVDLRDYRKRPNILYNNDFRPNLVIILGESFTPFHSSLYGYKKNTNPNLKTKLNDGLYVFSHVITPELYTIPAFKYILNTRIKNETDSNKWYEYINIIDVLNSIGYKTYWFSTQKEKGMFHNVSSGFSKLCNEYKFTSNMKEGYKFDEELLKLNVNSQDTLFAVFYHLMGQHPSFQDRYPKENCYFKEEDYSHKHPDIIAAYDNATLYNDKIVNSIINKYLDKNVIIFYLSDHGMDIYGSSDEYAGHALDTKDSKEISSFIPFMIYLSNEFKEKNPSFIEKILKAKNKEYCTDKFIYSVMDALDIKFKDNNNVKKYSIFNDNLDN